MKILPQNVKLLIISKDVRRLNPEIFGPVGGIQTSQPKPTTSQALESRPPKHKKGKGGMVAIVTLVAFRRRILDGDNNVGSFKALRDAIAATLLVDDGDPRIKWEYDQVETKSNEGVVVKMSICLNDRAAGRSPGCD